MGTRSTWTNVLLAVIALVLGAGFYFLVDATDILRQRTEVSVRELQAVRSELERLRRGIEERGLGVTGAFPGTAAQSVPPRFANADLRDPEAVDGGKLITRSGAETANMNSIINNDAIVSSYWELTYDSLASRNMKEPTRWEPLLAESWEISADKLTFTVHLRPNLFWHDFTDPTTGEAFVQVPVTAHDFRFYIDVIRNEGIHCEPVRNYFNDLDRIDVIDERTFRVIWKEPYFLSESMTLGLSPLPRHFYRFDPARPDEFNENDERNRMIVGCGPWVFQSWEKGSEVVFRRNENYYGIKPHLKEVRFKLIKEPNAALQALRKGEVDQTGLTTDQWMDQTTDELFAQRFRKIEQTRRVYFYIGWNMRTELFADRRVRLAMTHLVDRERILADVYRGLGRIVTGNFFIDSPYYDASIEPYPFDPARAAELLKEAGWADSDGDNILDRNGRRFDFIFLLISNHPYYKKIAPIIKEDMSKVGVIMNILEIEWNVYTQRLNEWNFDACGLGWSLGYEADPHQLWHSAEANRKNSSNHCGFANAEADRIIENGRREFDVDRRIALYRRFHRILHEEQPYTFLLSPCSLSAIHNRYRNVVVYPLGTDINSYWVPLAEQRLGE
ncbi:MAG: peptide-binding protein [Lentisphaeria bacterium]|nr:peptide-binding protein [Lentisphaeria bacterium]